VGKAVGGGAIDGRWGKQDGGAIGGRWGKQRAVGELVGSGAILTYRFSNKSRISLIYCCNVMKNSTFSRIVTSNYKINLTIHAVNNEATDSCSNS
jgi:hypothetical protein